MRLAISTAGLAMLVLGAMSAAAQGFQTGETVYAAPSAPAYWYGGCTVGTGRSNSSYQVTCAGTTYWIEQGRISRTAPQPYADPMRPGQTIVPQILSSGGTPVAPAASHSVAATPRAPAPRVAAAPEGPGNYAAGMARRIAQDKADAANAVLRPGKYSCYAGGRYTFVDLFITGAHSYTVKPGGSGAFSYANGALTFSSGPYAGAYSRMVDGHTIGISAKGNTNLGTQCGFDG